MIFPPTNPPRTQITVSSDVSVSTGAAEALGNDQTLIVAKGATVSSAGGTAIEDVDGTAPAIALLGAAVGQTGIAIVADGANAPIYATVHVGNRGAVQGLQDGIRLTRAWGVFLNEGAIGASHGTAFAITLDNVTPATASTVINSGSIVGDAQAISFANANVTLTNTGTIRGATGSLATTGGALTLLNKGTITGDAELGGLVSVTNRGTLTGNWHVTGDGAMIDNHLGLINGTVTLSGDNAVFMAGAGAETVIATGANATLSLAADRGTVTYALDGSLAPVGWVAGDSLSGFANVIGAATAVNILTGDAHANTLTGGAKNDVLHGGAGNDTLYGGGGIDQLYGDGGTNTLYGGKGNDFLYSGAGTDTFYGGIGADRFVFAPGALPTAPGAIDTIADFHHNEHDRIDLSAFDADPVAAGDQALHFIGAADFTHHAGELRYDTVTQAGTTLVLADLNGDGVADVTIALTGTIDLVARDFVL